MDHQIYIVKSGDVESILASGNHKAVPISRGQEISSNSEYQDLGTKIDKLHDQGRFKEVKQLVEATPGALTDKWIRFTYADSIDSLGMQISGNGNRREAIHLFEEARKYADACEGVFEEGHWNHEADYLRFLTRVHIGDCYWADAEELFTKVSPSVLRSIPMPAGEGKEVYMEFAGRMEEAYAKASGDEEGRLELLSEMGRHYHEATAIWEPRLKNIKGMFHTSMVTFLLSLGNVYVRLGLGLNRTLNVGRILKGALTGNPWERIKIQTAKEAIHEGSALRELSRQLYEGSGYHLPGYMQTFASSEEPAAEARKGIKLIEDAASGRMPGKEPSKAERRSARKKEKRREERRKRRKGRRDGGRRGF